MKHLMIFFANAAAARRALRFNWAAIGILALLVCVWLPQTAQAQDCSNPQTQLDMNECAARDYQRADDALNAAWGPSMALAKRIGQGDALRNVQRQWLAYRDAACQLHITPYDGGSIQPLIYSTCLTALTQERTRMLNEFKEF